MADNNDFDAAALQKKYGGKMSVDGGPVPLKRWMPQPSVNATAPRVAQSTLPDAGKPQKQGLRPETKSRKGK